MLYDIYTSGDYDLGYVSLVYKVGSDITKYRIQKRAYEELGISSVPDVYFDGKYTHVLGEQDDDEPYRTKITTCGSRDVPDIDVDVNVVWQENAILKITGTVQNNEPEDYNGQLRVYIVEPESRWNNAYGDPFHFGVLDIPMDRPLAVQRTLSMQQDQSQPCPFSDTYEFSRTWFGTLYGYGDITPDNIMVIATVFDKNTGYAVQVAAAKPVATSFEDKSLTSDGYINITAQEAWDMLNCSCDGRQIPIDVRTLEEYFGERIYTPSSKDWPRLFPWRFRTGSPGPAQQEGLLLQLFMGLYRNKDIIIYCRSGNRSFYFTEILVENNFEGNIYNMVGGITAWTAAGLPTVEGLT